MTKTNYELTIGGKLRKVYKNSGGFFVKMNGGNLNVNNYFLKNGSGLKSKYKTKGGDANEDGVFYNLVDIKFPDKPGNPVTIMVDSIIDHLNKKIDSNKNFPIIPFYDTEYNELTDFFIMFIYYALFIEAKNNDFEDLRTLIEYVLIGLNHTHYKNITKITKKTTDNYVFPEDNKIKKVIEIATKNAENFKIKDTEITWINKLFDNKGNFKTEEAAEAENKRNQEAAGATIEALEASEQAGITEQIQDEQMWQEAKAKELWQQRIENGTADNDDVPDEFPGGGRKNKNKVSSKNYLKKKLSNNKK